MGLGARSEEVAQGVEAGPSVHIGVGRLTVK